MLRQAILVLVTAAGITAAALSAANGAGPTVGPAAISGAISSVESVSFWGRPYPYGYRWRPWACFRPRWVDRPWGGHWEHVRICR